MKLIVIRFDTPRKLSEIGARASRGANAVNKHGEGFNMNFYRGIKPRGLFSTRLKTSLICNIVNVKYNIFTRQLFDGDNIAGLRRIVYVLL